MGVARRGRFQGQQTRVRRLTDWGFGVDMLNASLTASGKLLGTTSLTVGAMQTIVRIRGLISLGIEAAGAISQGFAGAAGIALVNSDAFAAGTGSIPGPQSDANWDNWMWHSYFDVRTITATIADGVNAQAVHQRIEIDSKAMRKWDPAETLVLMVEATETGVSSLRVNCDTRILLKAA